MDINSLPLGTKNRIIRIAALKDLTFEEVINRAVSMYWYHTEKTAKEDQAKK